MKAIKSKSTIQKQIRRLRRIAEDDSHPDWLRGNCYAVYHALWWVIGSVDWSPAKLAEAQTIKKRGNSTNSKAEGD